MNFLEVDDETILKSWLVTKNKIDGSRRPMCSISGGADSDIVLHLCATLDTEKKIRYVFFNTGLEYEATKRHIKELEKRYDVKITTVRPLLKVPQCVKEFGVPFVSKRVSHNIEALQKAGFQWEDEPLDVLLNRYQNCRAQLRWWCNDYKGRFNIKYNKYLKEFLHENPPPFKISAKCCDYAKKRMSDMCIKRFDADLSITGIRKSEGGARAIAYDSCFSPENDNHIAEYRPIFWYTNGVKKKFEDNYGIKHSDCYEVWGMRRTGCSGCPYALGLHDELERVKKYEPNMYKAMVKVFGDSYKYTEKYMQFRDEYYLFRETHNKVNGFVPT